MGKFPWGSLVAFVVFVGVVFALIQIGDLGLGQAGTTDLTETNETVIVNYDNPIGVSKSTDRYTQGFSDTVTVYNSSGAELDDGTDYTWNATTGEVSFINTTSTTDGESASITYGYDYNTEEVRQGEPILRTIVESVPLWALIPFILFVAGLFIWGASRLGAAFNRTGGR